MDERPSLTQDEARQYRMYALLGLVCSTVAGGVGVASLVYDVLGTAWSIVVIGAGAVGALNAYRLFRIFDRSGDTTIS